MMFESTNEKFETLRCVKCGAPLPIGTRCRVKTDVSGWLLFAECVTCPNVVVVPTCSQEVHDACGCK